MANAARKTKRAAGRAKAPGAASALARPASLLLLTVLAALSIVILCGLGFWQLQRMGEKRAFLDRLAAQRSVAPAQLPEPALWPTLNLDRADLSRVTASGVWLPQASATVRVAMGAPQPGERRLGGFGRYLITAMRLDNGAVVLVNRGFAPEEMHAALPAPTGRAQVIGILRKPEASNSFTPPPDPAQRDFHTRDPATIAAALNVRAAPFLIEAERSGDAMIPPVGTDIAELIRRVPNNHLQYALTWFGLAAALAGVFIAFIRAGRTMPAPGSDKP
jgi:surfeit locus 1 family protein